MTEGKNIEMTTAENVDTFFSDIVRIEGNPETVTLSFGIKSSDNSTAKITHKAIITLPHFFRFADIAERAVKDMKAQIEKNKTVSR